MSDGFHNLYDGAYAAAWQLPADARIASTARSLLAERLTAFRLPDNLVGDGTVAVSELGTNALLHAGVLGPYEPVAAPELWIYPRSHPQPQLVITVFDTCRDRQPVLRRADPLAECGNGLRIVAALSAAFGSYPSRSRVGSWLVPGKAVWFALALPATWAPVYPMITPGQAARRLHALLAARGLSGIIHRDGSGVSLISVRHGPAVWAQPDGFSLTNVDGVRIRRPLADLQNVAEIVVHHHELHGLTRGH